MDIARTLLTVSYPAFPFDSAQHHIKNKNDAAFGSDDIIDLEESTRSEWPMPLSQAVMPE
jgi:hypothetical protein